MAMSLDQLIEQLSAAALVPSEDLIRLRAMSEDSLVAFIEALVSQRKLTEFQAGVAMEQGAEALVYGEYVLTDLIGQGGMGVVHKAIHRRMKRVVAIKMLPDDAMRSPTAVQRFYREAEAAARLVHPNIVTAFDAGEARGTHYLVMEYVDGLDLSSIIRQRGKLPVPEAVDYITQAARGLTFAHQNGVVHRDIKPSNMLLSRDGSLKLLDMGLALLQEDDTPAEVSITGVGRLLGTAEYMAPEQALHAHDADHRSDIYSLGCTLCRFITGAPPYSGRSTVEMVVAHRERPIRKLRDAVPDAPEALEAVYMQMVAKRADDRFQSMYHVVTALEELVATGAVPRFERPGSRGESSASAGSFGSMVVPLARPRRRKDDEPSPTAATALPPVARVSGIATPASTLPTLIGDNEATITHHTQSETTSGAHGTLIDPVTLATELGPTRLHEAADQLAPPPQSAWKRWWPVAAVVAVAAIFAAAIFQGGPTGNSGGAPADPPGKTGETEPGTSGDKAPAAKPPLNTLTHHQESTAAAAPPPITATQKLQAELWGHWAFDEGQGSRVSDQSGKERHASFTAGGKPAPPSWVRDVAPSALEDTAAARHALRFDETSKLEAPLPRWNGKDPFTLAAWVKVPASLKDEQMPLIAEQRGSFALGVMPNHQIVMMIGAGPTALRVPQTLAPHVWRHVAAVCDGKQVQLFLDGLGGYPKSLAGDKLSGNDGSLTLGGSGPIVLDDVRLYGRALSAEEIAALASRPEQWPMPVTGGKLGRSYHAEQATGEPDTTLAGDSIAAWASLTPDEQPEWIVLDYARPVKAVAIRVFENERPGAIVRATTFDDDDREIELWTGKDPTGVEQASGVSILPLSEPRELRRIKLYLDSPKVAGWNEIDAVGLEDVKGGLHWAVAAYVSSVYCPQNHPPDRVPPLRQLLAGGPESWLDLLPLIDLKRDATGEGWSREAAALRLDAAKGAYPRAVVPLQPDGSYTLDIEFARGDERSGPLSLRLPVADRCLELRIQQRTDGQAMILYSAADRNVVAFVSPNPNLMPKDAKKRCRVSVRAVGADAAVRIEYDGLPASEHRAPLSVLPLQSALEATHGTSFKSLAISAEGLLLRVHELRLRMFDGGMATLQRQPPADAKLPVFVATPPVEEWLELLPLMDVAKDTVEGTWKLEKDRLWGGASTNHRIAVPASLIGNYQLRIRCTWDAVGEGMIALPLTAERSVALMLNSGNPPRATGLGSVRGLVPANFNNPTRTDWFVPVPKQVYEIIVTVRTTGDQTEVAADIDGRSLVRWKGPTAELWLHNAWRMPYYRSLGFITWTSGGSIRQASLRMLDGGRVHLLREPPGDLKLHEFVVAPRPGVAPPVTVSLAKLIAPGGGAVEGLALTGGGSYLASTTFNKHIRVWDLSKDVPTSTLMSSDADRCHVAVFSGDSRYLAAACNDRHVYIFEPGNAQPLRHELGPHDAFVWGVAFIDNNTIAAVTRAGQITIWNLSANPPTSKALGHHGGDCYGIMVSPDRKLLATCGATQGGGNVRLWSVATGQMVKEFKEHTTLVHHVDFVARPGKNLAIISGSHDKTLKLWDTVTGQRLQQFTGHTGEIWNVVAHPSGKLAFSCGKDGTVRAWDTDTGGELWQDKAHAPGAHGLAISGDGKRLATGGHDGQIRIYDVALAAPAANAAAAEIDLLAISDLDKDTNYGNWKRTPEGLLSQSAALGTDRLIPPVEVTGDYDLSFTVSPSQDVQTVVTLPIAAAHAAFVFHRFAGNRAATGLEQIGGLSWRDNANPTFRSHDNVDFSVPHTFDISVRVTGDEARVSASMDGQPVLFWQGSISKLTMHPRWVMTKPSRLTLNAGIGKDGGNVLYQRAILKPAGGTAKLLRAPAAAKDEWLDLLPLVDLRQDKVNGNWTAAGGSLRSGTAYDERVQLPIAPTGNYVLQVDFTRHSGNEGVHVILPVGNRQAALVFGGYGNSASGIEKIDEKHVNDNSTRKPVGLVNGQRYRAAASVAVTGDKAAIMVMLDGKMLIQWAGAVSSLSLPPTKKLLDDALAGVGSWSSSAEFHEVKLRMNGGSAALRREAPAGTRLPAWVVGRASDEWLDLLPLIDAKRDAVAAQWSVGAEGLKRTGQGSWPRLAVPVAPGAGGYRLKGVFSGATRPDHANGLVFVLPAAGKTAVIEIDPASHITHLVLDGMPATDEKHPARFTTFAARDGRKHTFDVVVAYESPDVKIIVKLDGNPVIQWKGKPSKWAGLGWQLPDPRLIGVGGLPGPRVLHELKLQMIEGKAEVVTPK